MNDKIEIVKLISGEYIIGKCDESNPDVNTTVLLDPRIIIMIPTQTGEMGVLFKPVCYPWTSERLKKKMQIHTSQIVYWLYDSENEIEKQFIDGYLADVVGIQIASQADLNNLNNKTDGGIII